MSNFLDRYMPNECVAPIDLTAPDRHQKMVARSFAAGEAADKWRSRRPGSDLQVCVVTDSPEKIAFDHAVREGCLRIDREHAERFDRSQARRALEKDADEAGAINCCEAGPLSCSGFSVERTSEARRAAVMNGMTREAARGICVE